MRWLVALGAALTLAGAGAPSATPTPSPSPPKPYVAGPGEACQKRWDDEVAAKCPHCAELRACLPGKPCDYDDPEECRTWCSPGQ
jgi:hypothetical protein